MTEPPTRTRHDPLAAWRVPAFRAFASSRIFGAMAMTMLQTIVAWQVYEISGSALQLGLIGLARFVPALAASLLGGAVADVYDRRRVIQLAQLAPLGSTILILASMAGGFTRLWLLYLVVAVTGLASSFENPARLSLVPAIVPRSVFMNAVTVNSTIQSMAFISGAAVGGLVIGAAGLAAAWATHGLMVVASIMLLFRVPAVRRVGLARQVSVAAIREGVRFVLDQPVLLGAMTLDMFAVIFGGAKALLPIYAVDILQVGAVGFGVLSASFEAGALLMSVLLVVRRPPERTGAWLLGTITAFGVATIVFGLSRSYPLSVAVYAAVGMADQISVVLRQTTVQLRTPDELRGRVSAVNMVFVGASNQLGGVESGVVAALTTATFAVVSGGVGCLAVVGIVAKKIPELRRYRAKDDERSPSEETPATLSEGPAAAAARDRGSNVKPAGADPGA